jgi:hypothetical protein
MYFLEQIINSFLRAVINDPAACKGEEIDDQMMWLNKWTTFILEISNIISNTH